jgi:hypothetical protein
VNIAGREPRGFIDFVGELRRAGTKKEVTLIMQRGRERRAVTVRQIPEKAFFNAELIRRRIGASFIELTPATARPLGLRETEGLYLEAVERGGIAEAAKLQRGMIVTAIDSQVAGNLVKVARRVHAKARGEKVRLDLLVPVVARRGYYGFSQATVELTLR